MCRVKLEVVKSKPWLGCSYTRKNPDTVDKIWKEIEEVGEDSSWKMLQAYHSFGTVECSLYHFGDACEYGYGKYPTCI